jgi:hypothetical protein
LSRSDEDFLMRHVLRRQKALCRHLSTPTVTNVSQDQGSRLHHSLVQRRTGSLSSRIAEVANMKPFVAPHQYLPAAVQAAGNHSGAPPRILEFSISDS